MVVTEPNAQRVVLIRFNRPRRLNAWSPDMLAGIRAAMEAAAADPAVGAVLLTGAGRYYSSGADFAGLLEPMMPSKLVATVTQFNDQLFRLFLEFPKPLIALVNGRVFGTPHRWRCHHRCYQGMPPPGPLHPSQCNMALRRGR